MTPGRIPNPLNKCPIPENAVALFFGDSVSWADHFPHAVFQVSGKNVFVIDKDVSGGLFLTFRVCDERGDLIARVDRNKFIATNAASHMERSDRHSLTIFDHHDEKVLDVHFLTQGVSLSPAYFVTPTSSRSSSGNIKC